MAAIVPDTVAQCQPQAVDGCCYRIRVAIQDPKTYLWATLCRLAGLADPGIDEMHRKLGKVVGRGTVQRIRDGETSIGLDALGEIASVFSLEVWQLLVPDVAAGDLPELRHGDTLLKLVSRDRLDACDAEERGYVSGVINRALDDLEAARRGQSLGGGGTRPAPLSPPDQFAA